MVKVGLFVFSVLNKRTGQNKKNRGFWFEIHDLKNELKREQIRLKIVNSISNFIYISTYLEISNVTNFALLLTSFFNSIFILSRLYFFFFQKTYFLLLFRTNSKKKVK